MTPDEIVDFTEALVRITASGGGPKALAAHLARAAGGGVLIEDAQWRHLAAAGSRGIPSSARGVVESGAPGRALRLTCGNQHVGWLSLFGTDSDPNAEILLRLTAAVAGAELGRDVSSLRGRKHEFWEALLAGSIGDASTARDAAGAHGIALASQYLCIVLEADAPAGELRALASDVFRSDAADAGFVERGQMLFAIVPAVRAVDASNVKTAAGLLPRSAARRKVPFKLSGGVGCLENASAVHASAATAQAALAIGRRLYGGGIVAAYDDLGAYPLLYEGADVARLRAFSAGVLAPLRAYDEKHATELERTLKLYFHVGQNVKTAAAELNVHRHTVLYRLRQIGEIAGRALENPHDQLTLRMAIAVDGLHE